MSTALPAAIAGPTEMLPEALPMPDLPNGPRLSLQQAIDRGVQHSLDVQAAAARRDSFEQTALAARGALLPRLDARAAIGQGTLDSIEPAERLQTAATRSLNPSFNAICSAFAARIASVPDPTLPRPITPT